MPEAHRRRLASCRVRERLPAGGLARTNSQMEIPVGDDSAAALWIYDLFCALLPQMQQLNLSLEHLGNVDTLLERIRSEMERSKNPVPCVALIGGWSRRPANPTP